MSKSSRETDSANTLEALAGLTGRLMLAAIFVISGYDKVTHYGDTIEYMRSAGLPGFLLPAAIVVELGGSLLVVVGWKTFWASMALAIFTMLAALFFHLHPGNENQMIHFMKNIAIAGGFVILSRAGPGAWSIDKRWS